MEQELFDGKYRMEKRLGGGGHINMAGTQFEGLTLGEVRDLIKKTIREMSEEGDI